MCNSSTKQTIQHPARSTRISGDWWVLGGSKYIVTPNKYIKTYNSYMYHVSLYVIHITFLFKRVEIYYIIELGLCWFMDLTTRIQQTDEGWNMMQSKRRSAWDLTKWAQKMALKLFSTPEVLLKSYWCGLRRVAGWVAGGCWDYY